MKKIMIAAMESGSGKTVISCTLMRVLQRRGEKVCAFKCGPDYIDPMFHKSVLSVAGRNLDVFLQGEDRVRQAMKRGSGDIAVIESAMGFYDGIGGGIIGSGWHIADITDTPVILVIRPGGSSLTLAAQVKGLCDFKEESHIAGLILASCKESLYEHLRPILEKETGLPVLGYMPKMDEAVLPSRHLGLYTAQEIEDLGKRFDALAEAMEAHIDIDRILELAKEEETALPAKTETEQSVRIAVARDEAFCFYYEENIEALEEAGAKILWFSPISDKELPETDGLYIGGGYPENHLKLLSENESMRESIRGAIAGGMPTVAECGGFMYLQESIRGEDGKEYPMVGALPGTSFDNGRLTRFGYVSVTAKEGSMLFMPGEKIPAHEFHYWDSTCPGTSLNAEKMNGKNWECGVTSSAIYAGFPHFFFDGDINLAKRFVSAIKQVRNKTNEIL